MPYVEDGGGLDSGGNDPWKGYPVGIVARVVRICHGYQPSFRSGVIGPGTRFFPPRKAQEREVDSPVFASLDLDSLDDVELIIAIEREFSVSIPDAGAPSIETVGQRVQYVKDLTG